MPGRYQLWEMADIARGWRYPSGVRSHLGKPIWAVFLLPLELFSEVQRTVHSVRDQSTKSGTYTNQHTLCTPHIHVLFHIQFLRFRFARLKWREKTSSFYPMGFWSTEVLKLPSHSTVRNEINLHSINNFIQRSLRNWFRNIPTPIDLANQMQLN